MTKYYADVVVIGEGENTIAELVKGGDYSRIKGIAYREWGVVFKTPPVEHIKNLDDILPARHLVEKYKYPTNQLQSFGIKVDGKCTVIVPGRGCPYQCSFCFKEMWGNKWRARSAESLFDEIKSLYGQGYNAFIFYDDTFVVDKKRVYEFCGIVKEECLPIHWFCNARVNLVDKDLLEEMRSAGCLLVGYGIESGNQGVLDNMNKRITLEQVRSAVKWTKDAGINASGYFMLGMPGETRKTIGETIDFARELNLDFYSFTLPMPIPGTELFRQAVEMGKIPDNYRPDEWSFNVNVNLTQDCSDKELRDFTSGAFKEFYLKKNFGSCYYFNPQLIKGTLKSLRNLEQVKQLIKKGMAIVKAR